MGTNAPGKRYSRPYQRKASAPRRRAPLKAMDALKRFVRYAGVPVQWFFPATRRRYGIACADVSGAEPPFSMRLSAAIDVDTWGAFVRTAFDLGYVVRVEGVDVHFWPRKDLPAMQWNTPAARAARASHAGAGAGVGGTGGTGGDVRMESAAGANVGGEVE